jgi:Fe-S oxidoreductases
VQKKIDEFAAKGTKIEAIAFIPDGESTLDSNLGAKIRLLRRLGIKVAVFSNSSLLWNYNVKQNLLFADYVSLKIDTVDTQTWMKINRPHIRLDHVKILDAIREFARDFPGELVTETMLISGYNDTVEEMTELGKFITELKPAHAYFSVAAKFLKNGTLLNSDPLQFLNLTDYITRSIPGSEITACENTNYLIAARA